MGLDGTLVYDQLCKEILMVYVSGSCDLPKKGLLMASVDPLSIFGHLYKQGVCITKWKSENRWR